jgi:hypothetical protein
MLANTLLRSLLTLAAVAAELPGSDTARAPDQHLRRDQLTQLSQRLGAGDVSAIDELLACTRPASTEHAPTSAEIERLRLEVERLRAARPMPAAVRAAKEARPAVQRDAGLALREARAWLRANDPNHCLKALPELEGGSGGKTLDDGETEALYQRACALERLDRDEEALDAYRRIAAGTTSPLMKLSAKSGVEHLEWRLRRARPSADKPEAKP